MDDTRIYSVDSETFNKLSHANDELIQYLQWLISSHPRGGFPGNLSRY